MHYPNVLHKIIQNCTSRPDNITFRSIIEQALDETPQLNINDVLIAIVQSNYHMSVDDLIIMINLGADPRYYDDIVFACACTTQNIEIVSYLIDTYGFFNLWKHEYYNDTCFFITAGIDFIKLGVENIGISILDKFLRYTCLPTVIDYSLECGMSIDKIIDIYASRSLYSAGMIEKIIDIVSQNFWNCQFDIISMNKLFFEYVSRESSIKIEIIEKFIELGANLHGKDNELFGKIINKDMIQDHIISILSCLINNFEIIENTKTNALKIAFKTKKLIVAKYLLESGSIIDDEALCEIIQFMLATDSSHIRSSLELLLKHNVTIDKIGFAFINNANLKPFIELLISNNFDFMQITTQ